MVDATWHYAVVVGIDQYPRIDNGRLDLQCPLQDAEDMKDWLTSGQGGNLAPERVKLLTRMLPNGRNPPVPVFDEINGAILDCADDFVARRMSDLPDDAARKIAWQSSRFYFYISGHGMDGDGDDAVLITANATRVSMNHISTRQVLNGLRKEKVFGQIVVLADCCREMAGTAVQPLPWDLAQYRGYNDTMLPKSFVAYASRNRRKAQEVPPGSSVRNSIFTLALLEGLQGGVAGQLVESSGLAGFLYNRVPTLVKQVWNPQNRPDIQTPEQNPDIKADPGIVFLHGSASYQITLRAPPGSAFEPLGAVDAVTTEGVLVKTRTTLARGSSGTFKGVLPTGYYVAVPQGADPFTGSPPLFPFEVIGEDRDVAIS